MDQPPSPAPAAQRGEVIDFDEALLEACPPAERAELLAEAGLLADALPAIGRVQQLQAIAARLSIGDADPRGRARARRLAAALRHLARAWEGRG